ncbi:MAG: energy transducer TonB [Spirochaetales bacterium]|nr:energy transducer TonB [Spirochaetales bacterium]
MSTQKNRLLTAGILALALHGLGWWGIGRLFPPPDPSPVPHTEILRVSFAGNEAPPSPAEPKPRVSGSGSTAPKTRPAAVPVKRETRESENTVEQQAGKTKETAAIPAPDQLTETTSEIQAAGGTEVKPGTLSEQADAMPVSPSGEGISPEGEEPETGGADSPADYDTLSEGLNLPLPVYPPAAQRWGYQGTVRLKISIAADGRVVNTDIVHSSGYGILDNSAVRTVRTFWTFRPPGRPVTITKDFVFLLE